MRFRQLAQRLAIPTALAGVCAPWAWSADGPDLPPPTAEVPGLKDRSGEAPLADLFAKADPKGDPAWRSEVLAELAGSQLKYLTKPLATGHEDGDHPLADLVAPDAAITALRPGVKPVFSGKPFRISRQSAEAGAPVGTGAEALAKALAELRAPYATDAEVRLKFKVIRVVPDGRSAKTVAYFEASGQGKGGGIVQQNATWACDWIAAEGAGYDDPPLLAGVRVSLFDETVAEPGIGGGALFADATEALLGANASYRDQLVFGADHWYGNLDAAFGIHQGNQGIALADADGDGRDDLLVCQPAGLPCRFFLQKPDGSLEDATARAGLEFLDASRSALFADLDNDGDQDLALTLDYSVMLLENDGAAHFEPRTVVDIHSWPSSMVAADYDNDGDLDLYIGGYNPRGETAPGDIFANPVPYHDANNGARNFLLRNEGAFGITDATEEAGLNANNRKFTFAAMWEDYDDDGDMDLYVANDFGRNNLYRNELIPSGKPVFTEATAEAGVEDIAAGMSVSWGDYNRDGRMDIYVSNMFSSAGNRITTQGQFKADAGDDTRAQMLRHARGNTLYENLGGGKFRDASVGAGVTMGRWAWGSHFLDLNNDGWEDIYVNNGFFTTPDTGDL